MWDSPLPSISPEPFLQFVRKVLPVFGGYQQQDAQEFARAVLDKMHEELETRKGRTMIMKLFQGKFENRVIIVDKVTCGVCNNVSTKAELFLDLSLSIPIKNDTVSLF